MPSGRFAPSPTGRLHLGNLRTALVAWLFARHDGSAFHLRFDDLDTAAIRPEHYQTQVDDLLALGLDWDGDPIRQSDRIDHYRQAIDQLVDHELVYPCYCSRREIREAAQAPNQPLAGHHYPGTCRHRSQASQAEQAERGRRPALRLRTTEATTTFVDRVAGHVEIALDDFVIQRNDGTPAYHLVTVVDDDDLGVELVVRADDLLDSGGRQRHLARLLGLEPCPQAHVGLVLSPDGERLAKRHGAVTLDDQAERGQRPDEVRSMLAASLELCEPDEDVSLDELLERFDPDRVPAHPLVLSEASLGQA